MHEAVQEGSSNSRQVHRRKRSRKNRYVTVGKAFIRDDKSVSIKVDAMPVGPEFSGWLNLYDLDEDRQAPVAPQAPAPKADEDLPF